MALFPVARAARAARPAPEPTYFQHPPMLATKAAQSSSASTHPATDATAHSERDGDERHEGEKKNSLHSQRSEQSKRMSTRRKIMEEEQGADQADTMTTLAQLPLV